MEIQIIKISEEERKLVSDFIGEDIGSEIDFNRLIPAIKKFMGIKNLEYKQLGKYNYWCIKIDDAVCSYDLQFTCATLINAIEWYNSEQGVKESDTTNDK